MQNEYPNLTKWCAEYSKKTGVKIYPQSAPLQLVLEDVVDRMNYLQDLVVKLNKDNLRATAELLEVTQLMNKILETKEDKKPTKKEATK